MDIKITIPDIHEARVLKGFCRHHGYTGTVMVDGQEVPNPETKRRFAKRILAGVVMAGFSSWEAQEAERIAREEALEDAGTIVVE